MARDQEKTTTEAKPAGEGKVTIPPFDPSKIGSAGAATRTTRPRVFAAPQFRPLDDDSVFAFAQRFAQGALGREFSPKEMLHFVEVFRRLERQSYTLNLEAARGRFSARSRPAPVPEPTAQGLEGALEREVIEESPTRSIEALARRGAEVAAIMERAIG